MPKWTAVALTAAAALTAPACSPSPEPAPVAGPCAVETSNPALYDALFEQIAAPQENGEPAYRSWPLFPGTEAMRRLGLPVHGRWTTAYADPAHAFPFLQQALENGHPQPLELPAGSIIVKENYRSGPKAMTIEPDQSTLEVLTVMYKPGPGAPVPAAATPPYAGFCATPHLPPYNGDPATGCLGGGWFYAFYKVESNQPTRCDTSAFGKFLNYNVNTGTGSFCIDCHAPGFDTDYLRILDAELNPLTVPPGPPPTAIPASAPACDLGLSPAAPADVPLNPLAVALGPQGAAGADAMFDCFSWRTFVALNWPADPARRGRPDAGRSILDGKGGPTVWQTYLPVYALFQPGNVGWQPPPFDAPPPPDAPGCDAAAGRMIVTMGSKARDVVNETGQAFAGTFGTLHDRNGELVWYEVLVNEVEYDYIVANGLAATPKLTPGGPAGFAVDFPWTAADPRNSIEVKSAWKRLCTGPGCKPVDDPSRYLTTEALIYEGPTQGCTGPVAMGLVGLHVIVKTFWAPQWVWATFEHVGNAPTTGTPEVEKDVWSFYDPTLAEPLTCFEEPFLVSPAGCPNVVLNRFPDPPPPPPPLPPVDQPDQITRLVPIDAQAAALNPKFQSALAGTPFANYVLVNAQWPLNGQAGTPAEPRPVMHACADNGLGENCFQLVPQFLRNTVIESYMTTYVTEAGANRQISNRSCIECHLTGVNGSYVWLDAVGNRVPVGGGGG